eukprot:Nitzschia sp. Nitz4//scaffold351_size16537//10630//12028//NITZ4_008853-RA/size16537-augustus-gene-0.1-mRNA-1//1//CDS//3329548887//5403//frame0
MTSDHYNKENSPRAHNGRDDRRGSYYGPSKDEVAMDRPLSSRRDRDRSRSRSPPRRESRRSRSPHYRDYYDDRHYDRRRDHHRRNHRENRDLRDRDHRERRDRRDHHVGHRRDDRRNDGRHPPVKHQSRPIPEYHVVDTPKDNRLGDLQDDPRGEDPTRRITKKASSRGNGRNTESFDPASTLVRPDLRVWVSSSKASCLEKPLKHDDVVIVPGLFGEEDDWSMYYQLVEEMRDVQKQGDKGSEWISWHEGAHLISKNPTGSPTFTKVIDRLCEYFHIKKESIGSRFNWYRDSSDWKPFHHDSAAFNPQRAKNQNITVGVSFGATRELAFVRAEPMTNEDKVRVYFPQPNNGVFSFGRDANILWKHGVNALPPSEQDGKGRISIILWGLAENVVEEEGSPPLLGSDGQGPHAASKNHHGRRRNRNNNNDRKRQVDGPRDQSKE